MKLASFDIFDTALIRKCGLPENVFYLLASKLFPEEAAMQEDFLLWRRGAEQRAKERVGDQEVRLADIYADRCLASYGVYSAAELQAAERAMEAGLLVGLPSTRKLIEEKRAQGYTICFISDMYLDSALLADIGTNGELALWHEGRLLCCSTAAGPVFEGAAISRGMQASPGAIDRVTWDSGKLCCHTIADAPAAGICGSGIIDAAAVFCREKIIDETGAFTGEDAEYPLTPEVALTQKDIRMLQLAKSAICAGMLTLLEAEGIAAEGPHQLIIAGGFGSILNLHSAACIGLFPAELEGRWHRPGPPAPAEISETVDLSSSPVFMENHVECMSFKAE